MPLAEIIFIAIVLYLAYRFVFNFLLPIMRATHQVREQFRNMQSGGPQHTEGPQPDPTQDPTQRKSSHKPPADDYIDFEEIKK